VTESDPIATANRLKVAGQTAQAIARLEAALAAQPDMLEARFNLAILRHEIGDLVAAEQGYRAVLARHPDFQPALQGLCGVLLTMDRAPEATPALRQLLAQAKSADEIAMAEQGLSDALKSQGQLDDALAHSRRALALAPRLPGAHAARGDILEQLGRIEDAIALYRARVNDEPADLAVHTRLNTLLFRLGREQEFLQSFDQAIASQQRPARLLIAKGDFLLLAGRLQEAEQSFAHALMLEPGHLDALVGQATAFSRLRQFDAAIPRFEQAAQLAPHATDILNRMAAALLQMRDGTAAEKATAQVLALKPYDQQALALTSLAQRLLREGRDDTLAGYEPFVRVFDLDPPEGFSSMADFNVELDAYLAGYQRDQREHLNQTLRGGTRAALRPFGAGHDLAERLKRRIDEAIARYIAELKGPDGHPFTSRRGNNFVMAGSWSSRITDSGYHLNHIHSGGWISSAYYVAVPEPSQSDPLGGHLKFGEPPWDIGLAARRMVMPKQGRLVLFPSYLWHGTVPIHGPGSRTTIAFDVLPL
jgi:tetratricopeptide (TPR) repeat protein